MPAPQRAPAAAPRIGLFGGSFDPVHDAHLALARSAIDVLALDELLWIPAGNAWQKARPLSPARDRVAMLELAIGGAPRQRIERCEIERGGPSYTIDTVVALQAQRAHAQWWLLLGQDQLANLPSWHRWRELAARVRLAVANRAGEVPRAPRELLDAGVAIDVVALAPHAVSSSEIRSRVGAGIEITSLVPAPVARYIELHGLYRDPLRS